MKYLVQGNELEDKQQTEGQKTPAGKLREKAEHIEVLGAKLEVKEVER
jgi:hypothetical protein